ncbi:DUF397 domain-containing protein [Actinomadura rubrisoli]|uniref:DUF397 domain-containing protein n=1 Tax=Actinomadura rubrisoli TaxID=2530368 RepID=A0A4R5BR23_9ACTN|nr:DUF397 domain-containing protein [Actinomadura rubrisoli]TDD86414.1 DUF397 domain-containing protein [Actinomadura rubrisoli]
MEQVNWRKSVRSSSNGENCVELAKLPRGVATRDSKDPDGARHTFTVAAMADLFEEIRSGRYDLG